MRKGWLLFFVSIILISALASRVLADCSSDQYIPLAYPDELQVMNKWGIAEGFKPFADGKIHPNYKRPQDAPPNKGYIWIPKEACGKSVDLLIALHGWRSLSKPTDSIYLQGIPGQLTQEKGFDVIIRQAIDSGQSAPIVVAAPMDDIGPDESVFQVTGFDINVYLSKLSSLLNGQGVTINRVSILGHSNANCGGGLARAAKNLKGYPVYMIASADGTCISDFITNHDLLSIASVKNSFLFHMRQSSKDISAAETIKKMEGGPDPSVVNNQQYSENWKSNDGEVFTYALTPGGDHSHTTVPQYLLREILPRFFSPTGVATVVTAKQPVGTGSSAGGTGSSSSGIQVGTTSATQQIQQNCQIEQRCKDIDSAWVTFSSVLGLRSGEVWVPPLKAWRTFADVYNPKTVAAPQIPAPSAPVKIPPLIGEVIVKGVVEAEETKCLTEKYGAWTIGQGGKGTGTTLKRVKNFPGVQEIKSDWFKYGIAVTPLAADALELVKSELTGYYTGKGIKPYLIYSGNTIRPGEPHCGNLHPAGLALDINPGENPHCKNIAKWKSWFGRNPSPDEREKCSRGEITTTFPKEIIEIFEKYGWRWGGRFNNPDSMHFEFVPGYYSHYVLKQSLEEAEKINCCKETFGLPIPDYQPTSAENIKQYLHDSGFSSIGEITVSEEFATSVSEADIEGYVEDIDAKCGLWCGIKKIFS